MNFQVLLEWITDTELMLNEQQHTPLPEDHQQLVLLLEQHQATQDELETKLQKYEKTAKNTKNKFQKSFRRTQSFKTTKKVDVANCKSFDVSKRKNKLDLVLLERRRSIKKRMEEIRVEVSDTIT